MTDDGVVVEADQVPLATASVIDLKGGAGEVRDVEKPSSANGDLPVDDDERAQAPGEPKNTLSSR